MIDGTTKRAIRSGWAPTNTSNLVHLLYFSVIWVVNNGNIKRAITKSGSRPSCEPSELGNLTSNNIKLGDISLYLEFMSNSSSLWIALGRQTQINFQKLSAKVMKYTWCEMGFLGPQQPKKKGLLTPADWANHRGSHVLLEAADQRQVLRQKRPVGYFSEA